ncbi:MAG: HindIII family type II restriction endonuclease [Candidatus Omnitrophica bacterium]|nr:HindIII family type II restriction endonuclease [Candidatus Omnitrophota bacterium]
MKFADVNKTIIKLCKDNSLDFLAECEAIQSEVDACSLPEILDHLDNAGIIPECFDHDSTEEKLFAKYCDSLLARGLREIGLNAYTIPERSDAADVQGKGSNYTIVGDAKAFRLSRTAKNQKDFKVEALDKWRNGSDFAVLVSPLYQYPNTNSQIYSQAIRYNVTLLSYTHLAFLIRNRNNIKNGSLRGLWEIGKKLSIGKSAKSYWGLIDAKMLEITGKDKKDWDSAIETEYKCLVQRAKDEIKYWEDEKAKILKLSHDAAIQELIKARKITEKVGVIKQFI